MPMIPTTTETTDTKPRTAGSDMNADSDLFWSLVTIAAVDRLKGNEPRLAYYCKSRVSREEFDRMAPHVPFRKNILTTLEFQPQQRFSLVYPKGDERLVRHREEGCLYSSLDLLLGGGVFSYNHATAVARNLTLLAQARGDMMPGSSDVIDPYIMDVQTGFVSMQVIKWILERYTPFRLVHTKDKKLTQGCGRYMVCAWSQANHILYKTKNGGKKKEHKESTPKT
jgi:hypothetical protein